MHYYKRNIGDYSKKAGRLTMLQHGAYTLLLDACYDRERFPTKEEAIDWCWASTTEEISAVEFVLSKFFTLSDGVYIQARIEEEVSKYKQNAETNARIAREREEKRRQESAQVVNEPSTNRAQVVNEPPPNHKPLTTNHDLKEGGEPPEDPKNIIWGIGFQILGGGKSDRALLGKLAKDHGEQALAKAISETALKNPIDPKSYLLGVLKKPSSGLDPEMEAFVRGAI